MKRRIFLARTLGLAAGAVGLTFAAAAARSSGLPALEHRVLDLVLHDGERNRPVPARLYLPQHAGVSHPVPLVVFSHGLGGSRTGYRYLGGHWADSGFASLHPQHAGSDHDLWRGNPLELVQRLQSAADESEARARVKDLRFALDHVLASDLAPLFDASRIAVAGHSYGANTAMLVSGARVAGAVGDVADLHDPRIRAAILISAPPLVGQGPVEKVLSAVRIPTLHVTSLQDTITLPGYRSTVADRIAIFRAMSRSPRTLAVFNAGGHSIFTDRTTSSGPETSGRIKGATRELSAIFLRQIMGRGNEEAGADVPAGQSAPERSSLDWQHDPGADRDMGDWLLRHQSLLEQFIVADRDLEFISW